MDNLFAVLGKLSYGMYAIGTMDGSRPTGCIVNTVFQITSENPIVAISMNHKNYTHDVIEKTGRFSVSILSEETPRKVITQLGFVSGRDHDKYDGLEWEEKNGLPVLGENISAAFTCKVVGSVDTETHRVFLGQVEETYGPTDLTPMTYTYYHKVIKGGAPKTAPSYVPPEVTAQMQAQEASKERWVCSVCGYVYEGDLMSEPDTFACPLCGVGKDRFVKKDASPAPAAAPAQEKERWVCNICGYVYEGDLNAEPDSFTCPLCGVGKSQFRREGGAAAPAPAAPAAEKERWICNVCGYVYEGDLMSEPDTFACPLCGVGKDQFRREGGAPSAAAAPAEAAPQRWVCSICGYIYEGDLTAEPDSFTCPLCGVGKNLFRPK